MNANNKKMPKIASIGDRMFGGFIDLCALSIFVSLFGHITRLNVVTTTASQLDIGGFYVGIRWLGISVPIHIHGWPDILAILVGFCLFSLMEYITGKTPGKYLAKIHVVTEDYQKITFWQAMLRNISRFIDRIGFYVVGFVIMVFSKNNQRLGDLLAKTYVVKDRYKLY